MPASFERRRTRAAGWSRRVAVFAAVLLLVACGSHRFGLLETPAFLIVLGIVVALALSALAFALHAFRRLWVHGDLGGADIARGVGIATLVLAPFAWAGYLALTQPATVDVSTDIETPPAMPIAAAERLPPMNSLVEAGPMPVGGYPGVTGRRYSSAFETAVEAARAVMARQGWRQRQASPAGGLDEVTFEATAASPVLGLPADVAVRVSDEGESVYVDMRSASRYGPHDLGDNAARINAFMTELDDEVESRLAGPAPRPEPPIAE